MNDFERGTGSQDGFSMKLWRGERMCLLGFDVDEPEDDFVGFAIECRSPQSNDYVPLLNRLAFSYTAPLEDAVTGKRLFDSTKSPFQKYRWLHFPADVDSARGDYTYRATKMHMPSDNKLVRGTSLELPISLNPVTYENFLDIGFTRNFASSQAYEDHYPKHPIVIPDTADEGLDFKKLTGDEYKDIYQWLGFEAYALIFDFLKTAVKNEDTTTELDVFAYDLNEPDLVELLRQLGPRLRVIIDDSTAKSKTGVISGHGTAGSAESKAADILIGSAGADHVKRIHFSGLQHNKVFILRQNGAPSRVLTGSTNFSFRGLYIQANNALVFHSPEVAKLYGDAFDLAFQTPTKFKSSALSADWQRIQLPGQPSLQFCFSPHSKAEANAVLKTVQDEVNGASSVLYAIAFLNQIKSGPTKEAFTDLMKKPVFSYGIVDTQGNLEVNKPDGSTGVVDFAYLSKNAPEPFKTEWSTGKGINVHHKFVVTNFNLPTAKVFTGSSNLAPSGEQGNGDNLILIEDERIAVSYALEAVRLFDHLHFRSNMEAAFQHNDQMATADLTLKKPTSISGKTAWFKKYYIANSYSERDRKLFSHDGVVP